MAAALRRNHYLLLHARPPSAAFSAVPLPDPIPALDSLSRVKAAIRSEPDPDRLADLFLSAASGGSPAFLGDRTIYRVSIDRLAAARRPDLVERLLEGSKPDHPSAPPSSEGFLIRVLTLYSRAHMLDHAARTFDLIARSVRPVSDRSLCALLSAFYDNRRFDRLREAFDRTPKELCISPGIASYNVFLKALCASSEVDAARQTLDEMPSRGVKPDIVSYNEVLNGYLKKGDEARFHEFLKEINRKRLKPNVVTFNLRITLLCAKGRSFEAKELLAPMVARGVYPNRTTFNTLISGFCKEGEMDSAMGVFKRMCNSIEPEGVSVSPNFETYIMLIKGLVEKGMLGPAVEVCKECLDKKWAPPFQAVKGLVEGLMKSSQLDMAKDVAMKMREAVKGDAADDWKKVEAAFAFKL